MTAKEALTLILTHGRLVERGPQKGYLEFCWIKPVERDQIIEACQAEGLEIPWWLNKKPELKPTKYRY